MRQRKRLAQQHQRVTVIMAKAMQEDVKLGWEWHRIEAGITIGTYVCTWAMCGWWTGERWADDGEPRRVAGNSQGNFQGNSKSRLPGLSGQEQR